MKKSTKRRFLVTSALPYSNGRLHVGHIAGAYLPADIYVRYLRAQGEEVWFICGSDDNGVAGLISARKEMTTIEELTAKYNACQVDDFAGLGIEFDIYGGTHQPGFGEIHKQFSQDFFKTIYEKGFFIKKTIKQFYDVQARQFLPDRYVKGTCYHNMPDGTPCQYSEAYGDQCEHCGRAIEAVLLINPVSTITNTQPELRETTHWYMQLSQFEDRLCDWLNSQNCTNNESPRWREAVLNFALGQIKQGLPERAMTRDLDWGVPVPLDDPDAKGKVLYVWFDAPIGYVSFTAKLCEQTNDDLRTYEYWWKDPKCKIIHFIGEDNIIFHTLMWPAMLLAEGTYQLPWNVVANSFLNIKFPGQGETKISKSRETAIWIQEYLEIFDPDPLRYYLTSIAPEKKQTTFDIDDFIIANNSILADTLGNFMNRTLMFSKQYFDGRVPQIGNRETIDTKHLQAIKTCAKKVSQLLESFQFRDAVEAVIDLARKANGYFNEKKPWKQRKEDLSACGTTINVCVQTIKALAMLIAPFLPFSAAKCVKMLNLDVQCKKNEQSSKSAWSQSVVYSVLAWDKITDELLPNHKLGEPIILFNKIDSLAFFNKSDKND